MKYIYNLYPLIPIHNTIKERNKQKILYLCKR